MERYRAGRVLATLLTGAILIVLLVAIRPACGDEASAGEVTVTFAATNPEFAVYRKGGKVSLQSASAQVTDTAERRVLTLYFSDLKNVDCHTADSAALKGASFVLRVAVYLPPNAPVALGKMDNLGVIFTTGAGPYFRIGGSFGSITLKQVSPTVTGTLALEDDKLKVAGEFAATLCH